MVLVAPRPFAMSGHTGPGMQLFFGKRSACVCITNKFYNKSNSADDDALSS